MSLQRFIAAVIGRAATGGRAAGGRSRDEAQALARAAAVGCPDGLQTRARVVRSITYEGTIEHLVPVVALALPDGQHEFRSGLTITIQTTEVE